MKTVKSYIIGLAASMALAAGVTACQDDFDTPAVEVPVAVNQANTTIAELKEAYWQDTANYADSVGLREDGSHYIIKGRVISSDEQGNVFKFITIQDATGAINFSVNSYNLYLNYRRGQEIVVDATGMYIGKYAGLQQFGTPSYYENGSTWQVGFMSPEFFRQHIELNGVPEVSKLDTVTVNSFNDFLGASGEDLCKWQSQLVRINNVHFQDGGVKTFSAYHSNANDDVNRTLIDADGNSQVVVRTSGYATFWNKMLPAGDGDIVGILSYYQNLAGATTWQLILNDYEGCMNFGNPTIAPGTENNPYTVAEVVKLEADGTPATGWVSGYIVGSVNPTENDPITNDDVNWGAEALMPYTLVIGADKETKDLGSALVIELPADSPLRQYGNLRDNPDNYGKEISVRGTFEKVMGTYGVAGNSGATSQFKIEGVQTGPGEVPEGDGTAAKPFNASQAKAKAVENGSSSTENVYVKGYIIGGAINMTYGTGTWTIANNPDGTGETFTLYGTYNTDNGKFTDENAVKVGDLVVAVGPIYNYGGNTPEMSKGHLVSINAGDSGDTPGLDGGDGTAEKPYSASQAKAKAIANGTESTENVYVKGYIISGEINMSYGTGTWVIADNAEGTGDTFTLYGTYNTDNKKFTDTNAVKAGDLVVAVGPIYNYGGKTPEMSKGHLVSINGSGSTVNPGPTPDDPIASGSGSESDPYNCAGLIALKPTDKNTPVATGVWVKGYIIGYMPSTNTKPENTITTAAGCDVKTNIVIAPTLDEKDFTKCVPVQLPTEANAPGIRSALNLQDNPDNLGKEVLLNGNVILYCGAPGLKDTKAYKFVGGGAVTPDPPTGGVIFSESFENGSLGQFSTTVETSGTWTGWYAKTNAPLCAIANSYVNGGNEAATAWLISPAIDLASATTASIKLEQAYGFYFPTKQESFCTVNIREKGGQWTALTLTEFPTKGTGNWTSFAENTIDITAYAGKTVEIGFKYVNDGAQSIAWEIKNFSVTADAGSVTTNPDPVTPPADGDPVTIMAADITAPGTSTISGYTIVTDKASSGTAPKYYEASKAVRFYYDNTIEIKGPRMASITFTIASTNSKRYTTVTPSTGEISPAQQVGDTSFTWVGDATDVTFTVDGYATLGSDGASARGQVHVTSIVITPAE